MNVQPSHWNQREKFVDGVGWETYYVPVYPSPEQIREEPMHTDEASNLYVYARNDVKSNRYYWELWVEHPDKPQQAFICRSRDTYRTYDEARTEGTNCVNRCIAAGLPINLTNGVS